MGAQLAHALRHYFRRPPVVLQLAFLATLLSAAIIVLMAVGSAQVLAVDGSEALPMVYLLLAAVSVPLASGISAALGRWSVARISTAIALVSACVVLALRGALALELPGASSAVCITAYALEIVFDTLFWLSASEHLPTLELKRHTRSSPAPLVSAVSSPASWQPHFARSSLARTCCCSMPACSRCASSSIAG
ncbi:MAG: hypothetical protein HWD60_15300 [Defluviicoccus sp.]|nr:MAG: hypothetical protein HWD60_15300 [Defluviicoccus sp.]